MTTLTLQLPDDKHQRLLALAKSRGTTVTHLLDDMATLLLAESDAEARFELRQARGAGRVAQGQALLDKAARGGSSQAA